MPVIPLVYSNKFNLFTGNRLRVALFERAVYIQRSPCTFSRGFELPCVLSGLIYYTHVTNVKNSRWYDKMLVGIQVLCSPHCSKHGDGDN